MAPIIYNVKEWLNENQKFFAPPICNKLMYKDGYLKTFFVGGPNSRKDFHMEEGEEFFFMMKGDMTLVVSERREFQDIPIREGEVFLLPARIPHSPQRLADTIGLVIERERTQYELDCLRYYVENSNEILYEKWFRCKSLEELGPLIEEFFASEQYKTGKPIPETLFYYKPIKQDFERRLERPFSLKHWLQENEDVLNTVGKKKLFTSEYVSRIFVLGKGSHSPEEDLPETFLMQIEGKSILAMNSGASYELSENETALIPHSQKYTLTNDMKGRTISVIMNPLDI